MSSIVVFFVVVIRTAYTFLFNSATDMAHCYELDVENCFREAFLAAIHPPIRERRALTPLFHSRNITVLEKRRTDAAYIMLCHDVRRFSLCFHHPGCSEQTSASIASVQYHMVFGKKLPLHIFLAYKGYGKQICEQSCSRDALLICRNAMSSEEQLQEQNYIVEALSAVQNFAFGNEETCFGFRKSLSKLIRLRGDYCGDLARCTCGESRWEIPIVRCSFDCEQTWGKDALDTDSAQKAPVIAVFFLIHMFM
ncbi:hypothetical protein Angca_000892 [Angiostrongylus cantonensis]|nr:hypothetical protein Angca_000892 [Angiostrongylus cantonensis]